MLVGPLGSAGAQAQDLEDAGYSGGWTIEGANDPFLPHVLAAEHSTSLELGTAIAVAFARNPMTLAHTAWDLQAVSAGRFILGLRVADQAAHHQAVLDAVEPSGGEDARADPGDPGDLGHVDHWCAVAVPRRVLHPHVDDPVLLTRSNRRRRELGVPRIFLAGVGPAMTEVAGEVADGFICHPLTTERYLREVTLPALRRGRDKIGKDLAGFEISGPSFVVTGGDRGADGRLRPRNAAADRLLRVDSCVPCGARPPRLG